jgi:hypothetical protein
MEDKMAHLKTVEERSMQGNLNKLSKKLVERELTIRYLLRQFQMVRERLKHCREIKDNKQIIYTLQKKLERIEKNILIEYKPRYDKSLSNFKRLKVGLCDTCGKQLEDITRIDCETCEQQNLKKIEQIIIKEREEKIQRECKHLVSYITEERKMICAICGQEQRGK